MARPRETIASLKDEVRRLKEVAYRDELTRLYNRRGFKENAEKFLKEVALFKDRPERRESLIVKNLSLIVFDIDHFKKFNDTYGHQAGDKVLKLFSEIITKKVREIDLVARWGGEEIVVGLIGAGEKDAVMIAEEIRQEVEKLSFKSGKKIVKFTVSGGAASFDRAKDFDTLFESADKALYEAKRSGRNRIVAFSSL